MSPPLARTSAEAHLYLDRCPCDACGERGFSGTSALVPVDGEMFRHYSGDCGHCGAPRTFLFRLPVHRPAAGGEFSFGGPEPSELLDPGEWLAVADLAASWRSGSDAAPDLPRAAAAVDEVLKFIPDGADAVPPEAFRTADGQEMFAREPGRFRRVRLEAVAATYRDLIAAARGDASA